MVLRKRTIMHYTPYMQACCTYLLQQRDAPSDQMIAWFVEIEVLQRKISNAFCHHDISTCDIRGERALQITVDSYSQEIDRLKKATGSSKNAMLGQQLHFLEVWTREVALYDELWQSNFTPARLTQQDTDHSNQFSMQRTNMLWQLVTATLGFHDWSLSVPNTEIFQLPFSWWAQHSYIFIVQIKTVSLDGDGGTGAAGKEHTNPREHDQAESLKADFRRAAEKAIMIPHVLDMHVEKLSPLTTQLVDDDGNKDMVSNHGTMLKSIKSKYESQLRPETRPVPTQTETQQKQSYFLQQQLSHPEFRSADTQASIPSTFRTNHVDIGVSDPHSSAAGQDQLDLQFDFAEPAIDEFMWDTMMNDFSFFAPMNVPPI